MISGISHVQKTASQGELTKKATAVLFVGQRGLNNGSQFYLNIHANMHFFHLGNNHVAKYSD